MNAYPDLHWTPLLLDRFTIGGQHNAISIGNRPIQAYTFFAGYVNEHESFSESLYLLIFIDFFLNLRLSA